jgi:hypothetical protein
MVTFATKSQPIFSNTIEKKTPTINSDIGAKRVDLINEIEN